MTHIERRQTRIRRIRKYLKDNAADPQQFLDTETSTLDLKSHYYIGKTQNNPVHMISFVQKNEEDPAIKVCFCMNCEKSRYTLFLH